MAVPAPQMSADLARGPVAGPGEPAPGAAPTRTPQRAKGNEAAADSKIAIARRMLEEALVAYGSDTEKGKGLLKILSSIVQHWGKNEEEAEERTPAELKNALMAQTSGAPPAPGGAGPAPGAGAPQPNPAAAAGAA